eukprot:m.571828 g.571828  ORF g.571828 m.571828 type:complete len:337 (-) comp57862_c0_seq22:145-1155(-)
MLHCVHCLPPTQIPTEVSQLARCSPEGLSLAKIASRREFRQVSRLFQASLPEGDTLLADLLQLRSRVEQTIQQCALLGPLQRSTSGNSEADEEMQDVPLLKPSTRRAPSRPSLSAPRMTMKKIDTIPIPPVRPSSVPRDDERGSSASTSAPVVLPGSQFHLALSFLSPNRANLAPLAVIAVAPRFWGGGDEELVEMSPAQMALVTVRTVDLDLKPAVAKWACRVPLRDGSLCPRMDLTECPYHGRIIARDQDGVPLDAELARRVHAEYQKKQQLLAPKPVKRRFANLMDTEKATLRDLAKRLAMEVTPDCEMVAPVQGTWRRNCRPLCSVPVSACC